LSQVEVIEISADNLIGQYVGQTGPKTIKQLERGLGKVLFVDEAYRLGQGNFAQDAINVLVDTMTKPKFAGKMVIILAGYDNDMNNLLRVNEGLSSRFADDIIFPSLSPDDCLKVLESKLKGSQIVFPSLQDLFVRQNFCDTMKQLSKLPAWGNARDIETLAKSMTREVFKTNATKTDQLVLSEEAAMKCLRIMLADKLSRSNAPLQSHPSVAPKIQTQDSFQKPPHTSVHTSTATSKPVDFSSRESENDHLECEIDFEPLDERRDAGVSDATWEQLQNDKKAADLQSQEIAQRLQAREDAVRAAEKTEKRLAAETAAAALREAQAKDEAERSELLRLRELARIQEMEAKAEREKIQQEFDRQRQVEFERRKKEEKAQRKLREMGVCVMGFQWIKQSGGYRCGGGTHYITDGQLGM
jgi:hypothetical protein